MSKKKNTAILSVISNSVLILLKLIVGIITGSVSILSEAVHSMTDLVAAVVAFFSVRIADKPADEKHPYGHEKMENISGVIEGLLILGASGWILFESVNKIMTHEAVREPGLGIAVMFISALVNTLVSRRLYKVAKEEESMALEADALHLKADVITSLGVGIGLLLIWVTGLNFLDPLVAIFVALFILREAWHLMGNAFQPLMDHRLSHEEIEKIAGALEKFSGEFIEYHDLRTRRSGKIRHVDFHLTMHKDTTLFEAHGLCDRIEAEIEGRLRFTKILIHPETCGPECQCHR